MHIQIEKIMAMALSSENKQIILAILQENGNWIDFIIDKFRSRKIQAIIQNKEQKMHKAYIGSLVNIAFTIQECQDETAKPILKQNKSFQKFKERKLKKLRYLWKQFQFGTKKFIFLSY